MPGAIQSEEFIRLNFPRLAAALEYMPVGVTIVDSDLTIPSNPLRLKQALINYANNANNAIKFSEQGGIAFLQDGANDQRGCGSRAASARSLIWSTVPIPAILRYAGAAASREAAQSS